MIRGRVGFLWSLLPNREEKERWEENEHTSQSRIGVTRGAWERKALRDCDTAERG